MNTDRQYVDLGLSMGLGQNRGAVGQSARRGLRGWGMTLTDETCR